MVGPLGALKAEENKRSRQALQETIAMLRGKRFKASVVALRGRRLKHPNRAVVIFVSSGCPEDIQFLPKSTNGVKIIQASEPFKFYGANQGTTAQEQVSRCLEEHHANTLAPFVIRGPLAMGSGITHVTQQASVGTLGLLLKSKDPRDENYYALTCGHVVNPDTGISAQEGIGDKAIHTLRFPFTEEGLMTTPLEGDYKEFMNFLKMHVEWITDIPEREKENVILDALTRIARDSAALHVGQRVNIQFELIRRQDGSLCLMDIGIIRLNKDRIGFSTPNRAFYKHRAVSTGPGSSPHGDRRLMRTRSLPFTFGAFNEVNEKTRFGVYGFMTTCDSEQGHAVIQDTDCAVAFLVNGDTTEEVYMKTIVLPEGSEPARPKPSEEDATSGDETGCRDEEPFCIGGDSGAMVFDLDNHHILGMVIAGLGNMTFITIIDDILGRIGQYYTIAWL